MSWTTVPGATGWEYQQRIGQGAWGSWTSAGGGTATSYTVGSLTNGTRYGFRVRATKDGAGGRASDELTVTPAQPPLAPRMFQTDQGDAQVRMVWLPATSGVTPTGWQYRQKAGTGNWAPWTTFTPESVNSVFRSHRLTGLMNGTLYTTQLRALNGDVAGPSAQATATPQASAPPKPTGVSARAGDASVQLRWTALARATGWEYQQAVGSGAWSAWTPVPGSGPSTTGYAVTGLTNGTAHAFRVRAVRVEQLLGGGSAKHEGPPSDTVAATPASRPGQPQNLKARPGDGKAVLSWRRLAGATGWQYRFRTSGGWNAWTSLPGGGALTGHTVAGLANHTLHIFQVRARNDAGFGRTSVNVDVTPTPRPARPVVTATAGYRQVELTWAAQAVADSWEYRRKSGGGAWSNWTSVAMSGASTTGVTVAGLTNGTAYSFQVRARNDVGTGPESQTKTATPLDPPGRPAGVSAEAGDLLVTLTWNALTPVAYWEYQQKPGSGPWSSWTRMPGDGALTRLVVTGLSAGTLYSFKIRARNAGGASAESAVVTATPVDRPAKPSGVRAEPGLTPGTVKLFWDAQGDVTHFEFRWSGNNGPWSAWARAGTSSATSFVTQPFRRGIAFGFQVRGVSDDGPGPASDVASVVTLGENEAPENLLAMPGDRQVRLSWRAVPWGQAYDYRQKAGNGEWGDWTRIQGGETTSHTVTGLLNGTSYSFQVRAWNEGTLAGLVSHTVTATPSATRTGKPTGLSATARDMGVELSWSRIAQASRWEYQQRAGTSPWGAWTRVPNSGAGTDRHRVTGLSNGTSYSFRVRAVSAAGAGTESDVVTVAIPATFQKPPAPVISNFGDASRGIRVGMAPVPEATSFEYRTRTVSGEVEDGLVFGPWSGWATLPPASWTHRSRHSPNPTPVTVHLIPQGNLASNMDYGIEVRARNSGGVSGPSNEIYAPIGSPRPLKPQNLRADAGNARVDLAWDAQDGARGWQYRQKIGSGSWSSWIGIANSGYQTAALALRALNDGTTYSYRVRASNSSGFGPESDVASATPGPTFGAATVADQVWIQNGTITALTLPAATGGDAPLTYGLSPDLPAGLSLDETTRQVTGKPTTPAAAATYTWKATDSDATDPDSATLTFDISVPADVAPVFTSAAEFRVAEKQTAVGTVVAVDRNAQDSVTGYALAGGADQAKFEITSAGVLTFKTAPDFESPQDVQSASPANAAMNNEYVAVVRATSGAGTRLLTSDQTITVTVVNANDPATGLPTISGTRDVGQTLSASTEGIADQDGLTGVSFAYQWIRVNSDASETDLSSATSATYMPVEADDGKHLKVRVDFTDNGGSDETLTSSAARIGTAPGVEVATSPLSVPEGSSATYTLKLTAKPTHDVTITVTKETGGDADLTLADTDSATPGTQNTLTFTPTDWSTAQALTVNAAQDDDSADGTATFKHAAASTDSRYNGSAVTIANLVANEDDDDVPSLVIPSSVSVNEGATATYGVKLKIAPTAAVTVTISGASGEVTVDTDTGTPGNQSTLAFSTTDWNTARNVTVSAGRDADTIDDTATLTHTASGAAEYVGVTRDTTVTVTDANPGITVTGSPLSVNEGSSNTYTVVLDSVPSATVGVSIDASGGDTDLTANPTALLFDQSNWSTPKIVTIFAAEDDADSVNGSRTFQHTASSGDTGYKGVSASLVANEVDNDLVLVNPLSLHFNEGFSINYTVRLTAEPTHPVTITITRKSGDTDLSIADTDSQTPGIQNTLKFTASNWSTAQTLTVNAAQDDDAANGTATFKHAASSTDPRYGSSLAIADLTANEVDDDAPTLAITGPTTEQGAGAFTVTFTFSETVEGFAASDVTVPTGTTKGTLTAATGANVDKVWTLALTPAAGVDATDWTVSVAQGAATSKANGVGSAAATKDFAVDTKAPAVASAEVVGKTLTVTFDEDLGSAKAANDAWTVDLATGTDPTVSSYAIAGKKATLTLSAAVPPGVTVELDYDKPGTGAVIEDVRGNDLADFDDQAVTNSSARPSLAITGPTTEQGAGAFTVTFTFSETVEGFAASDVTVPTGTTKGTLTAATGANVDKVWTLALTPAAGVDATDWTVSVAQGAATSKANGVGSAAATKDFAVDTKAPAVASAEVVGKTLTVTFDEDLGSAKAANDAWTVDLATGTDPTVSSYAIAGKKATLTLSAAVPPGVTVELDYDKPGTGAVIEDVRGNDLADFDDQAVTNSSARPSLAITGPTTEQGAGAFTVTFTFSETVEGFAASDVTVPTGTTKGTLTAATGANVDKVWTLALTPAAGVDATDWTVSVAQGAATSKANGVGSAAATKDFAVDTKAPAVASAEVVGKTLTVTFDEDLGSAKAANDAWTVDLATGTDPTVSSYAIAGKKATLTLSAAVPPGVTVELDYDKPGTGAVIEDVRGNDLADFDDQAVTNSSVGVEVATSPLTVPEGSSATYTLKLAAKPTEDVTVTITKEAGGDADLTLADTDSATPGTQNTLTFTPTDWSTAQVLTVNAAQDDDSLFGSAKFQHAAASTDARYNGSAVTIANLVATERDDDANTIPVFGSATIDDQTWYVNRPITLLQLPEADGGNGTLTYTLSPDLPSGIAFDDAKRQVSGAPTVEKDSTTYTYKVTDADGDYSTLTFNGAVAAQFSEGEIQLTADRLTQEGARLTLSSGGTWWYKGEQSGAACTPVTAGTTRVTLTGLSAATAYTYKAYSAAGCASANELTTDATDAEFTTLAAVTGFTAFNDAAILLQGEPIWYYHRLEWNTHPQATWFYIRSKLDGTVNGSTDCAAALAGTAWTLQGITNWGGVYFVGGKTRFKESLLNRKVPGGGSVGYACYQVQMGGTGDIRAAPPDDRATSPAIRVKFGNPPADHGSGRIFAINGTSIVPDPVAEVTVTHNGSSLEVSWDAPARATHYDVTYTDTGSGQNARAAWNRAGTSLTIACDSRYPGQHQHCVAAGATYTVAVRARNANGESAWVNSAPAAQPPQAQQAQQAPDPVAEVRVAHRGSSLEVSWDAPARATHYDVTYTNTGNGENARAAWNRAGTSLTITCDVRAGYENQHCVDAGAAYTVGVRARNANGESAWVNSGPASAPALSVADATADEPGTGESANLDFVVTLDRPLTWAVTVDYATGKAGDTATAGADYTPTAGTLSFAAGETSKTVSVPVLADAHDDAGETLTLTLSNPSGARIADATATGTIANDGPIPKAWTARFGRTVADQVLEAVESRMRTANLPGAEVVLGGERIGLGTSGADTPEAGPAGDDGRAEALKVAETEAWLKAVEMAALLETETGRDGAQDEEARTMSVRDFLLGSSFSLTSKTASGGLASFWGRWAATQFEGREGGLALDGEVTTAMLGVDRTRGRVPGWSDEEASGGPGRWSAGLILSHSTGEGGYSATSDADDGDLSAAMSGTVEARLTGLFPWARNALTDRIEAWAVGGFGQGEMTVTPEGQPALVAGLDLRMAATGLRGAVLEGGEDGLSLAARADAMVVETASGRGRGESGGTLAPARATATRLRVGLEASRSLPLGNGAVLTPVLEAGVRHDGGDAETGFGIDLGGGISLSAPELGLEAEIRGRGLLSHATKGFRERGVSGSLSWRQRSDSDRGATLSLKQDLGGSPSGGVDSLLSRATLDGLAADSGGGEGDDLAAWRTEASFGYGLPALGNRFTLTPEAGAAFSDAGRDFRMGLRLTRRDDPGPFEFALEAARRESDGAEAAVHEVGFRIEARW